MKTADCNYTHKPHANLILINDTILGICMRINGSLLLLRILLLVIGLTLTLTVECESDKWWILDKCMNKTTEAIYSSLYEQKCRDG